MTIALLCLVVILESMGIPSAQEGIKNIAQRIGVPNPYSEIYSEIQQNYTKIQGESSEELVDLDKIPSLPETQNPPGLTLSAGEAISADLNSAKILYKKNIHESRPIASVTKIMTSVIAIEKGDFDEVVEISRKSAYITGSKIHLLPGEKIKIVDLIRGMLIASANDAASAIQEYYGKENLINLMNEKAKWLGLKETKFSDATGLDQTNLSSVADLVTLSRYALKNKFFAETVAIKEYTIISVDGRNQHLIHTTNRLLKNYPDIFGIKTGFTEEAGNCLVAGARQKDKSIISIVLNVEDNTIRFNETRELLDWTFNNYKW